MIEIPVSDLLASDVGKRVVVARDGNTFDGTLTDLGVMRHDWNYKSHAKYEVVLTVKTLTMGSLLTQSDDKVGAKLELRKLPLDYLIQVERSVSDD